MRPPPSRAGGKGRGSSSGAASPTAPTGGAVYRARIGTLTRPVGFCGSWTWTTRVSLS